jgi:hypothetical protein
LVPARGSITASTDVLDTDAPDTADALGTAGTVARSDAAQLRAASAALHMSRSAVDSAAAQCVAVAQYVAVAQHVAARCTVVAGTAADIGNPRS